MDELDRIAFARESGVPAEVIGGDAHERRLVLAELLELRHRERQLLQVALRRVSDEAHNLLGMWKRERLEKDVVD